MDPIARLVAGEPKLNATMAQGHLLVKILNAAKFTGVRLFANPTSAGGADNALMVPETSDRADQDDSWIDAGQTLDGMTIPDNQAMYLQFRTNETGSTFYDVAQSVALIRHPDPIFGLLELMAMLGVAAQGDAKVLSVIASLPDAVKAVKADFGSL